MKMKNIVAMVMALVMLIGLLAGCNQEKPQETNKPAETQKPQETTPKQDDPVEPAEKVKLTWYMYGTEPADMDVVEAEINKMLEGRLNATVEFIFPANLIESVNMMTTSGEAFDLAYYADWFNPNYPTLASKGALLDLSDLLDQYGPAVKEIVPEGVLDACKIQGGLYAIPNYQTSVYDPQFVMSQELVDKYNIDIDSLKGAALDGTAVEKVSAIFETIKQNEPDKFPFYMTSTVAFVHGNIEELGGASSMAAIDRKTGEVLNYFDYMKEVARVACEWYAKGYIREDVMTVSDQSGDIKAGRFAGFVASDAREGSVINYGSSYGIEGEVAYVGLGTPYANANHPQSALTVISRTSEHPVEAMQLVNLMFEDVKLFNTLIWGVEGTHWTMNADGTIKRTEAGKNYSIQAWTCGNTYSAYVEEGSDPNLPQLEMDYMAAAQPSLLNGFIFDNTNVSAELANCTAVRKEFGHLMKGACSLDDFESEWTRYKDAMYAAGYETLYKEIVSQVNAFLGK